MLVSIQQAKSELPELIAAVEAGDVVIITRNGKPAVKLVPLNSTTVRFGYLSHLAQSVPDFEDGLDEDELDLWERDP